MLTWILAVLALYVVQLYIEPLKRIYFSGGTLAENIRYGGGPRDEPKVATGVLAGRAKRASDNLIEALPVFLTLALLAIILEKENSLTVPGAMAFFFFRLAYLPAYLSGIPKLRSLLWFGGFISMAVMAAGLVR